MRTTSLASSGRAMVPVSSGVLSRVTRSVFTAELFEKPPNTVTPVSVASAVSVASGSTVSVKAAPGVVSLPAASTSVAT